MLSLPSQKESSSFVSKAMGEHFCKMLQNQNRKFDLLLSCCIFGLIGTLQICIFKKLFWKITYCMLSLYT